MQRPLLLIVLLFCWLQVIATGQGPVPVFEPQFFDLDGNGTADVRYSQTIRPSNETWPRLEYVNHFLTGLTLAQFLRAQGTNMNFSPGQTISAANPPQADSGLRQIMLTDYLAIHHLGFSEFYYIDWSSSWNTLTNGIAGVRLYKSDRFYYGWIRVARPDFEPTTPFAVVDHAWNPIPDAPIAAGEAPPLPLLHGALGESGFVLNWDNRFPGLLLERAETLAEPANWQPVETPNPGSFTLPATGTTGFYRLRLP